MRASEFRVWAKVVVANLRDQRSTLNHDADSRCFDWTEIKAERTIAALVAENSCDVQGRALSRKFGENLVEFFQCPI
jgi:hypothetical protein